MRRPPWDMVHVDECGADDPDPYWQCTCDEIRADWRSVADEQAFDQLREEGLL